MQDICTMPCQMWAQEPSKPKSGTLSNGKWNTLFSIVIYFLSLKYFTLYQHLISMFYVRSWANSENSMCNYCILTTTWRLWFRHQEHSSVQQIFYKPLPIDQHVTLQQAIVRSIKNVQCISIIGVFLLRLQFHFNERT